MSTGNRELLIAVIESMRNTRIYHEGYTPYGETTKHLPSARLFVEHIKDGTIENNNPNFYNFLCAINVLKFEIENLKYLNN